MPVRDIDVIGISGEIDDPASDGSVYGGGAVDSGGGNTPRRECFRSTIKECGIMKGKRPPCWVVS